MMTEIIAAVYANKFEELLADPKRIEELRTLQQEDKPELLYAIVSHYCQTNKNDYEEKILSIIYKLQCLGVNITSMLPDIIETAKLQAEGAPDMSYLNPTTTVYHIMATRDRNINFSEIYNRKLEMFKKLGLSINTIAKSNVPAGQIGQMNALDSAIRHDNRVIIPCFVSHGALPHPNKWGVSVTATPPPRLVHSTLSYAYRHAPADFFADIISQKFSLIPTQDLTPLLTTLLHDIVNNTDNTRLPDDPYSGMQYVARASKLNALLNSPWIDLSGESHTNPNPRFSWIDEPPTALDRAMANEVTHELNMQDFTRNIVKRAVGHFIRERFRLVHTLLKYTYTGEAPKTGSETANTASAVSSNAATAAATVTTSTSASSANASASSANTTMTISIPTEPTDETSKQSIATLAQPYPKDVLSIIFTYIDWRDLATIPGTAPIRSKIMDTNLSFTVRYAALPPAIHFCDAAAALYFQGNSFYAPPSLNAVNALITQNNAAIANKFPTMENAAIATVTTITHSDASPDSKDIKDTKNAVDTNIAADATVPANSYATIHAAVSAAGHPPTIQSDTDFMTWILNDDKVAADEVSGQALATFTGLLKAEVELTPYRKALQSNFEMIVPVLFSQRAATAASSPKPSPSVTVPKNGPLAVTFTIFDAPSSRSTHTVAASVTTSTTAASAAAAATSTTAASVTSTTATAVASKPN